MLLRRAMQSARHGQLRRSLNVWMEMALEMAAYLDAVSMLFGHVVVESRGGMDGMQPVWRFSKREKLEWALLVACQRGRHQTVQALVRRGARVGVSDGRGHNALHTACFNGDVDVVRVLLDVGCALDIMDANGHTALLLAAVRGHHEIVRLLLSAGAKDDGEAPTHAHAHASASQMNTINETIAEGDELMEAPAVAPPFTDVQAEAPPDEAMLSPLMRADARAAVTAEAPAEASPTSIFALADTPAATPAKETPQTSLASADAPADAPSLSPPAPPATPIAPPTMVRATSVEAGARLAMAEAQLSMAEAQLSVLALVSPESAVAVGDFRSPLISHILYKDDEHLEPELDKAAHVAILTKQPSAARVLAPADLETSAFSTASSTSSSAILPPPPCNGLMAAVAHAHRTGRPRGGARHWPLQCELPVRCCQPVHADQVERAHVDCGRSSSAISPPMITMVSRMASADEEPAWLSHAAASVDLGGGFNLRFKRAVDALHAAYNAFSHLSAIEVADGLLSLSASYARGMRIQLRTAIRELRSSTSAVFTAASMATPGTPYWHHIAVSVRSQQWNGALMVPFAGLLAMLAVLSAVLAMMVTFVVHTPRAAREFRAYAADAARHYGVGRHSLIGRYTTTRMKHIAASAALSVVTDSGSRRPQLASSSTCAGDEQPFEQRHTAVEVAV